MILVMSVEWIVVFIFVIVQVVMAGTHYSKLFVYCHTVWIISDLFEFIIVPSIIIAIFPFRSALSITSSSKNTDSNLTNHHVTISMDNVEHSDNHDKSNVGLP
jgi:hypothetical protein